MVEIGGKPILWHIMRSYHSHGIVEFIVCLGYKGYVIKEWFQNYRLHTADVTFDLAANTMTTHRADAEPWQVTLVETGLETMTGGRLRRVRDYVGNEPFCFTYGDAVSTVDIRASIAFHEAHGRAATVTAVSPPARFGLLDIQDGAVRGFQEKPTGAHQWINGGFFVLQPSVFDLIEAVMGGDPAAALAITAQAHERGADLGLLLGDLLELTHTLTRLRAVPGLQDSTTLPEMERVRGAALAARLDIPTLGRAWQMLLKGVAEVELADDRRAAAEMVLIRLCYVADLPPPGELVRRLTDGTPARASPYPPSGPTSVPTSGPAPGPRAVMNGAPLPAPALGPRLDSFRDVAMLAAQTEPLLHGHLLHAVHLVRFAPNPDGSGHIELRPEPSAPRELSARLAALLSDATGARWTVAISRTDGEPTLAAQGEMANAARHSAAALHPLVQAIMDAFPGATISAVNDSRADAYGLVDAGLVDSTVPLGEPEGREFAPPEADEQEDL